MPKPKIEKKLSDPKSTKMFRVSNLDANDSMEAIELITEIKRMKSVSAKNKQKQSYVGTNKKQQKNQKARTRKQW